MSFLVPAREAAGGTRFRVLGFPVTVEWAFFVIMPLLGLALGDPWLILAWVAIAGVSILAHELGHAVAFRTFGLDARIVLHGFGGVTFADGELASRWRRVTVSLAGPFTGLLLFGLPALLVLRAAETGTTAADLAWLVVWVNVGWSVLNLLPILPLDGGHVAREALLAAWPARGEVASRVLSVAVAGGLAVLAFSAGAIFLGALAAWLGYDSVRALQGRREEAALDSLRAAAVALGQGDAGRARSLAAGVASGRGGERLRPLARELEAWAALTAGDEAGARAAVATLASGGSGHLQALLVETDPAERLNRTADAWVHGGPLPPPVYVERLDALGLVGPLVDRLLDSRAEDAPAARARLVDLLAHTGGVEAAARLGEGALALAPEPGLAYATACAHARIGRIGPALDRLATAVDLGFTDTTRFDRDPALVAVRSDPRFAAVRARLPTS